MALVTYRAQVRIPSLSAIPEDDTINVWHFLGRDPASTQSDDALNIATRLDTFYTNIGGHLATVTSPAEVKIYNLAQPEPRVPVRTEPITFVPSSVVGMPREVALVITMSGAIVSGMNPRRRRGRVYIGPLSAVGNALVSGDVRPSTTRVNLFAAEAGNLTVTTTALQPVLAVFSPTTLSEGATLEDSTAEVETGWVDNSYDIQRRRGADATVRTPWLSGAL